MAKILKLTIESADKDVKQLELKPCPGGNAKWFESLKLIF